MSITLPTTCVDGTCAEQQTLGQAQRRRVPGETGVWLFIFGDMMVFAACFIVFLVARSADPMLFEQSRNNAKVAFGAINTLLLLTGSWFVVRGVRAIHSGRQDLSPKLFATAMACGAVFGVNKFIEWGDNAVGRALTCRKRLLHVFLHLHRPALRTSGRGDGRTRIHAKGCASTGAASAMCGR
jgi:heme/copper-type cytochrome/quinol oxidase subunit 3